MTIATINPATGKTLRSFDALTDEEVQAGINRADGALNKLRSTDFAQRAEWMIATALLLEAEVESTAAMITLEMGKPIAQSRAEVQKCARALRYYAERAEGMMADEPLDDPNSVNATRAWISYEPIGIVLAVMPWNYPLWQVIRFAAPALMAGNVGLLKHASNVPESALYLGSLFERGGFPEGSFQVLLIGSAAVNQVIADPRVKAVTLTGSEGAGRSVGAAAGQAIKKAVLELGGSDPFIVMPSADIARAAETAVKARISNNGQSCIAGKRFIVHADVYDQFRDEFVSRMEALSVGDPMDESVDVGPLATESGRDELAELVDDAVALGAQIATGGHRDDRDGWFYPPTIVENLPRGARLVQEEAFGPVASLYRVADREEAVRIANQTAFGLSSSVWSTDEEEQNWFVRSIDSGGVFINGMTISYPELPFGGVKDSGYGRELSSMGLREFTNIKTVWKS